MGTNFKWHKHDDVIVAFGADVRSCPMCGASEVQDDFKKVLPELLRAVTESAAGWDIITALRGPDSDSLAAMLIKNAITGRIRYAVSKELGKWGVVTSESPSSLPEVKVLISKIVADQGGIAMGKRWIDHYFYHCSKAVKQLGGIGLIEKVEADYFCEWIDEMHLAIRSLG